MSDPSNSVASAAGNGSESIYSAIADIVSAIAWPCVVLLVLFALRNEIHALLRSLSGRLRSGAAVKMGAFEVGAVNIDQIDLAGPGAEARLDDGRRAADRRDHYRKSRSLLLVHRIAKSRTEGQEFDILVYLIPQEGKGTLAAVSKVEYYFGSYWGDKIFSSAKRYAGFPVRLSAYGPTLCTAEVFFTDGQSVILHRFLDFEMGASAPMISDTDSGT